MNYPKITFNSNQKKNHWRSILNSLKKRKKKKKGTKGGCINVLKYRKKNKNKNY